MGDILQVLGDTPPLLHIYKIPQFFRLRRLETILKIMNKAVNFAQKEGLFYSRELYQVQTGLNNYLSESKSDHSSQTDNFEITGFSYSKKGYLHDVDNIIRF